MYLMSLYDGFFNDYESIIWNFENTCFFIFNRQLSFKINIVQELEESDKNRRLEFCETFRKK